MITNHFRDAEDKLQFAKVLDRFTAATKKRQPAFTDFLDPMRCAAFMQILTAHASSLDIVDYGGYPDAERKIIGFFLDACSESASHPITAVAVSYNSKFSKPPTHRDYLGAILGLGLERTKIGDIRLTDINTKLPTHADNIGAVIYVASDIASYIIENLTTVGRTTVKTAELPSETSQSEATFDQKTNEKRITVASMRLDGILSAAFNMSRGKAAALIEAEKVFVNWKPAKKTQLISEGDAITIRGIGRIKIGAIQGRSKKDRIVLSISSK